MEEMVKIEKLRKNAEKAREYFEDKVAFTIGPVGLKRMIDSESDSIKVIDVRASDDYISGHIPGAESFPAGSLEFSTDKLSKDRINILYCYDQQCHLAAKCACMLAAEGFPVMELEGGFNAWYHKDYEIVTFG